MKFTLAIILLAVPFVAARCPNACSSHGKCGEFDSCVCDAGFTGAACDQRQCPTGKSWVTTAAGDLNMNGNQYDTAVYEYFSLENLPPLGSLRTQSNRGGAWEAYPAPPKGTETLHQKDAHFDMVCSNRGVCNYQSGQCECFEGYTGIACQRNVCPNDCSGKGVCKSTYEIASSANADYYLWDKDMSMACVCDSGFTGIDCSERECPKGDDPLTVNQFRETQTFEIKARDDSGAPCSVFEGTITLSVQDTDGATWETDPISIMDSTHTSETVNLHQGVDDVEYGQMQADILAALQSLPNDVGKDVSVEVNGCRNLMLGQTLFYSPEMNTIPTFWDVNNVNIPSDINAQVNNANVFTAAPSMIVYECPGVLSGSSFASYFEYNTIQGGDPWYGMSGNYIPGIVSATEVLATCYPLKPNCLQVKISYPDGCGDVPSVAVDVSEVTYQATGRTMSTYQDDANTCNFETTSNDFTEFTIDSAMNSDTPVEFYGAGHYINCEAPSNPANGLESCNDDGARSAFTEGARVEFYCMSSQGTSNGAETESEYRGQYTVGPHYHMDSDDEFTTDDKKLAYMVCEEFRFKLLDDVVFVSQMDLSSIAPMGSLLEFDYSTTEWDILRDQTGAFVTKSLFNCNGQNICGTWFFLDVVDSSLIPDAELTISAGDWTTIKVKSKGNTECSVCADRGVCDSGAGQCVCFEGYTGDSCDVQQQLQ